MRKLLYILCCSSLLLVSLSSLAQNPALLDNDSLLKVYLGKSNFDIDPGADAVVLYQKATADFKNYQYEVLHVIDYTVDYKVEKVIKVIKNSSLNEANVSLPYSRNIKVKDVTGTTINLENGNIVRQKLDKKSILKEQLQEEFHQYKFNMANVKAGTIVHYTFTYSVDLTYYMRPYFDLTWSFQDDFPVLKSEFELIVSQNTLKNTIVIPKNMSFTNRYSEQEFEDADEGHYAAGVKIIRTQEDQFCIKKRWKKSHILPLKKETYVSNWDNKEEKLKLIIAMRSHLGSGSTLQNWDSANYNFYYNNLDFGQLVFIKHDTGKDSLLDKVTQENPDQLALAQSIYKYFRDSVGYTKYAATFSDYLRLTPKDNKKKSRNLNLNLRLTQILRKAGLKAFPVVLSTTDNGSISYRYFEPDAINYVVSLVSIGDRYYLLDSYSKYLPFGVLKPRCYNDFAWLISEKGIPITLNPDSLIEKTTYTVAIKPAQKPGMYQVKMDHKLGNVSGPTLRALLAKDSVAARKEIEQSIHQLEYKTKLRHYTVNNKDNPDTALIISYELDMELDTLKEMIYFNPFLRKFVQTNPFTEATRRYPVEFGNAFNYTLVLKFQLPENYQVEDYNNPVSMSLNKDDIQYRNNMQYDPEQRIFTLSSVLQAKVATIPVEDYEPLRSLYDKVVTEQNKKIAIRKIK